MDKNIAQNVENRLFSEHFDQKDWKKGQDAFLAKLAITCHKNDTKANKGNKEKKRCYNPKNHEAKAGETNHKKTKTDDEFCKFGHHAESPICLDCPNQLYLDLFYPFLPFWG